MPLARVTTHVDDGLERQLSQFKDKPLIEAWLRSYLRQCQVLEDAIYDVILSRMIDRAVGAQQDQIGRIVGQHRQGRDDNDYRLFLRAKIRVNRSKGAVEDIFAVGAIIFGVPWLYDEYPPACFLVELLLEPPFDPVLLYQLIHKTKAAGVGMQFISPTAPEATRFLPLNVGDANVANNGAGDASAFDQTYGLVSDVVTDR